MKWISVNEKKPSTMIICWVVNNKWGLEVLKAIYHPDRDVFVLYNPNHRETICVDVTHWIEEPIVPIYKE